MTTKTKPRKPATKNEEAGPEQLPGSGRWRIYYWHPIKKTKIWVKNPEPGSRGTWPDAGSALLAREEFKARLDGALIAQGIPVQRQTHRPNVPTVPQAIEEWLELQDGTKATITTRRYAVKAFSKQWPDLPINELDEDTYVKWDLKQKEAGLSTSTRANRLIYMGQIIRWCVKKGWRKDDFTEHMKPIKVRRIIRPEILTRQNYTSLTYWLPFYMLPALVLAYECGLRAGEIAGLRWKRIDLDGPVPTVMVRDVMENDRTTRSHTKGGGEDGEREVVLSAFAVEILKGIRRWRGTDGPDDFVVRNTRNRPVPPNYLGKRWIAAWRQAEAAGEVSGPRPRFHDLRHAAGTSLAAAGAPITVIMDVLGHDDPKMTKRYLREAQLAEMAAWMSLVGQQNEVSPVTYLPTPVSPEATTVDQLAASAGLDADAVISIVAELGRRGLLRDVDPLGVAA
jgi:integrase